jgi:hypothetical protein
MNDFFDDLPGPSSQTGDRFSDRLGLDPLSPVPAAGDPLRFMPAHGAGDARMTTLSRQPTGSAENGRPAAPCEVFPTWRRAQLEVNHLAREALLAPCMLRTTGFLRPELAERVTDWFTAKPTTPTDAVRQSYRALEREAARLFEIVRRAPSYGGLGVRVQYVHDESDPYRDAAELCGELREHGSMTLRTIACDEPHPLLGGEEGGVVDKLRVVHDVFGHAALGVGFDLQSEFATWLQCRTLFSDDARRAAFCEFVAAVTTYIMSGEKPALRADLPPTELVAACDVDATRTTKSRRYWDRVRRTRGNSSPAPAVTSAANVAGVSGFLLRDPARRCRVSSGA